MDEKDWKVKLSKEEYEVLREKGTERPYTGKLLHNNNKGVYVCKGCDNELFDSKTKFDSRSGWPSFFEPISDDAIKLVMDTSFGWP